MAKRITKQLLFARRWQTRAEGAHESPRNGDFVSRPRFKVAYKKTV
jgi:hypothetical protein